MLWRRIASQSEVIRAILLSDSTYVVCVGGAETSSPSASARSYLPIPQYAAARLERSTAYVLVSCVHSCKHSCVHSCKHSCVRVRPQTRRQWGGGQRGGGGKRRVSRVGGFGPYLRLGALSPLPVAVDRLGVRPEPGGVSRLLLEWLRDAVRPAGSSKRQLTARPPETVRSDGPGCPPPSGRPPRPESPSATGSSGRRCSHRNGQGVGLWGRVAAEARGKSSVFSPSALPLSSLCLTSRRRPAVALVSAAASPHDSPPETHASPHWPRQLPRPWFCRGGAEG